MAENVEEAVPDKPKGGKLWILVAVLIVVVSADLTFRALSYLGSPKPAAAASAVENGSRRGEKKAGAELSKSTKAEIKIVAELAPFLVNLVDADAPCYVKATFQLGMAEDTEPPIRENPVVMPSVRDTIISLLGSKSSAQILSTEGKDKLREEIRNRVNAVLSKGTVQEVYITDFVVSP